METVLFTIDPYYGNLNHNMETVVSTIDPYYDNLNLKPLTRTQSRLRGVILDLLVLARTGGQQRGIIWSRDLRIKGRGYRV